MLRELAFALGFATTVTGATSIVSTLGADRTAFLVAAPDRGFTGNEEIRDVFEEFAAREIAELVFVTDERTRDNVAAALDRLKARGATRVVVLPFFLSAAEARFARLEAAVREVSGAPPLIWGRIFGASHFAVEALADRMQRIGTVADTHVVVAGFAERAATGRVALEADLAKLARHAASGRPFASVRALVWSGGADDSNALEELHALAARKGRVVVVPFHLGPKLDGMMAFNMALRRSLPEGVVMVDADLTPDPLVTFWLRREATRHTKLTPAEIGVVVHAHGSDFHWNETMRQAAAPLAAEHPVEYAFSMGDPLTLERALRRLEARGAKAAVIVRVFALEDSFRTGIERFLGLDVEYGHGPSAGERHGHHGHDAPVGPRLRSPLAVTTVGGLEDDPRFAQVLLERARSLSLEPARETVILVAHGSGDDDVNARWLTLLESLRSQMLAAGGDTFRAIRVATWREDWEEKRAPWIERVRAMIEEARRDGGRAIVIPARTLGTGPERRFLSGLDYALGEGFAPHPLFVEWLQVQVEHGIAQLTGHGTLAPDPSPVE
ncbi:MAG TPA: CbiX/SirB N-terminal domain-containing protein [Gammaproteobacteria bacterium]|nr:CbiX/SirB N-terminal domain-containing protein [Gammaproteobacteria bacterium]